MFKLNINCVLVPLDDEFRGSFYMLFILLY